MQIFGTDLKTFCRLERGIEAQQYTGSICHGCGITATAKMRCAKCTSVAYCNKVHCTTVPSQHINKSYIFQSCHEKG
jgi:hypothetical protein